MVIRSVNILYPNPIQYLATNVFNKTVQWLKKIDSETVIV